MDNLVFRWDPRKAMANARKHGVTFEEAVTVFQDPFARGRPDVADGGREDRFLLLGVSERLRILMVVHAVAEDESGVRIISARRATRNEQRVYWEYR